VPVGLLILFFVPSIASVGAMPPPFIRWIKDRTPLPSPPKGVRGVGDSGTIRSLPPFPQGGWGGVRQDLYKFPPPLAS